MTDPNGGPIRPAEQAVASFVPSGAPGWKTHASIPVAVSPPPADTDEQVIAMWLHERSANTLAAYRADVDRFRSHVRKSLRQVTLADLQGFVDTLAALQPRSRARMIASIGSLFRFAERLGYLSLNPAVMVRRPKVKNDLAERILSEEQVHKVLALEANPRNHALLRLLYYTGMRVSEVCALTWQECQPREDGKGQITIHGKGEQTRFVLLPAGVWAEFSALRHEAPETAPVFVSRKKGGRLTRQQVHRIVQQAATRAGIQASVGPHHLRHAHASHALDRGAPVHVVQATLGHASLATTSRYTHVRPGDSSGIFLAK